MAEALCLSLPPSQRHFAESVRLHRLRRRDVLRGCRGCFSQHLRRLRRRHVLRHSRDERVLTLSRSNIHRERGGEHVLTLSDWCWC